MPVTMPLDPDATQRLADRMISLMQRPALGPDPGNLNAKAGVASVLMPLRDLLRERDGAPLTLADLDTLIAVVREAEHVETARFDDHVQICEWADRIVHQVTGSFPDSAPIGGDCHGCYVGPSRELVRIGEEIEAVITDGHVVFRPAHKVSPPAVRA